MTIFTVIDLGGSPSPPPLDATLAAVFPGQHYKLAFNAWLVAAAATATDVSNRLGLTQEGGRIGVVTEVGGYFGRANPEIWTWIKTNWEGRALA
ncbi:hypothetical protein [Sphingomonas sp.]|uniref:hypothetical protein n=1 Tax=Sphingomonas sp. TaxID=28214 RepID=UPI003AFFEBD1